MVDVGTWNRMKELLDELERLLEPFEETWRDLNKRLKASCPHTELEERCETDYDEFGNMHHTDYLDVCVFCGERLHVARSPRGYRQARKAAGRE